MDGRDVGTGHGHPCLSGVVEATKEQDGIFKEYTHKISDGSVPLKVSNQSVLHTCLFSPHAHPSGSSSSSRPDSSMPVASVSSMLVVGQIGVAQEKGRMSAVGAGERSPYEEVGELGLRRDLARTGSGGEVWRRGTAARMSGAAQTAAASSGAV